MPSRFDLSPSCCFELMLTKPLFDFHVVGPQEKKKCFDQANVVFLVCGVIFLTVN